MTRPGIEPGLQPWKGRVLTAWPSSLILLLLTTSFLLSSRFLLKAPRVGLEPTTHRLTADCSTTELSRIIFESGNHLLSQAASHQVSSAVYVLTIVFGMETGVPHRRIITRYSFLIYSLSSPLLGLPAFLPCTLCTLSRLSLIIRFLNISYTFKTE